MPQKHTRKDLGEAINLLTVVKKLMKHEKADCQYPLPF